MHRSYIYTCIKKCSTKEGRSGKTREAKNAEFGIMQSNFLCRKLLLFFIIPFLSPQPPTSSDFITVKTHRRTERNIYIRINPCGKKYISQAEFSVKMWRKKTVTGAGGKQEEVYWGRSLGIYAFFINLRWREKT